MPARPGEAHDVLDGQEERFVLGIFRSAQFVHRPCATTFPGTPVQPAFACPARRACVASWWACGRAAPTQPGSAYARSLPSQKVQRRAELHHVVEQFAGMDVASARRVRKVALAVAEQVRAAVGQQQAMADRGHRVLQHARWRRTSMCTSPAARRGAATSAKVPARARRRASSSRSRCSSTAMRAFPNTPRNHRPSPDPALRPGTTAQTARVGTSATQFPHRCTRAGSRLSARRSLGDELAQLRVASRVLDQHAFGPQADRFAADDQLRPWHLRRLQPAHDADQRAFVGDRQRHVAAMACALEQFLRARRATQERNPRGSAIPRRRAGRRGQAHRRWRRAGDGAGRRPMRAACAARVSRSTPSTASSQLTRRPAVQHPALAFARAGRRPRCPAGLQHVVIAACVVAVPPAAFQPLRADTMRGRGSRKGHQRPTTTSGAEDASGADRCARRRPRCAAMRVRGAGRRSARDDARPRRRAAPERSRSCSQTGAAAGGIEQVAGGRHERRQRAREQAHHATTGFGMVVRSQAVAGDLEQQSGARSAASRPTSTSVWPCSCSSRSTKRCTPPSRIDSAVHRSPTRRRSRNNSSARWASTSWPQFDAGVEMVRRRVPRQPGRRPVRAGGRGGPAGAARSAVTRLSRGA